MEDNLPGTVVLSDKAAETYGLTPEGSVPLQEIVKLYLAEDRGKLLTLIAQALQDRRGFRCRLRIERRDGRLRMIETIADLRIRDGRVTELFGVSKDVTAEMERELQVQGRLKLVQDLIGEMPIPIAMLDDKLRCSTARCTGSRRTASSSGARWWQDRHLLRETAATGLEQPSEYALALTGQTVKTRRVLHQPDERAAGAVRDDDHAVVRRRSQGGRHYHHRRLVGDRHGEGRSRRGATAGRGL